MKIGLLVPHVFMQDVLRSDVIFAPGDLAVSLADGYASQGHEVTLYTPGSVATDARNSASDMSEFEHELELRGYGFTELLRKHPLTFATLARQVQADTVARAFSDANEGKLDIIHVYTNEEDIALHFSRLCSKPVVFTHHDPFNLTIGYKRLFPHFKDVPWLAMSEAQKIDMPQDTNWLDTIHHGLAADTFRVGAGTGGYVAYLGRVIESKGVHHAIAAVNAYNATHDEAVELRIAGKFYDDPYYSEKIEPHLNEQILFEGYIDSDEKKNEFLGQASATIMPSVFAEPFGMVAIESLACGTPVIGLESGALPEIITDARLGKIVPKGDDKTIAAGLADAISASNSFDRSYCRQRFEDAFTATRMVADHLKAYERAIELQAEL